MDKGRKQEKAGAQDLPGASRGNHKRWRDMIHAGQASKPGPLPNRDPEQPPRKKAGESDDGGKAGHSDRPTKA